MIDINNKIHKIAMITTAIIIIGAGTAIHFNKLSTQQQISKYKADKVHYQKLVNKQKANKKKTIETLPNIYTTIENAGKKVLDAQVVMNKAFYDPQIKKTDEYIDAFNTMSKYVSNDQSFKPATTPWTRMLTWNGSVNIGGSTDGNAFDTSFTYKDANDRVVCIVECQYLRDDKKFENFKILMTTDGSTQQSDALSKAQNSVVK